MKNPFESMSVEDWAFLLIAIVIGFVAGLGMAGMAAP